jgi:hypothetical protein
MYAPLHALQRAQLTRRLRPAAAGVDAFVELLGGDDDNDANHGMQSRGAANNGSGGVVTAAATQGSMRFRSRVIKALSAPDANIPILIRLFSSPAFASVWKQ